MKAVVLHGYDETLTAPVFLTCEEASEPERCNPTDVIAQKAKPGRANPAAA